MTYIHCVQYSHVSVTDNRLLRLCILRLHAHHYYVAFEIHSSVVLKLRDAHDYMLPIYNFAICSILIGIYISKYCRKIRSYNNINRCYAFCFSVIRKLIHIMKILNFLDSN